MNNYIIYPQFASQQFATPYYNVVAQSPLAPVPTPSQTLLSPLTLGIVAKEYSVVYEDLVAKILALPSVEAKMSRVKPNGFAFNFNNRLCLNLLALLLELGVLDTRSHTQLGRMLTGKRVADTINYNEPRYYPTELNDQIIADVKQLIANL